MATPPSYMTDKTSTTDLKANTEMEEMSLPHVADVESVQIDNQAEKDLVRRLDLFIVPVVMFTYLLCFLDRTNIGNARLFGLERDLNMTGTDYQLAVAIMFVPYVLVEVPSNVLIKRFTPSRWLAAITIGWGLTSTLMGIVHNFAGLMACRVILGLLEGGLFPGLTVYLTMFYTKKELALRIGYLFVSSALAGACGGLLAYGIGFMDGIAGQSGWRWVFILEGTDPLAPIPSQPRHRKEEPI
jgi:MFS family permease